MPKYFPIRTETSCQLKWAWSTLFLNSGQTASCHRTGWGTITPDNFSQFHNTEKKQQERQDMLEGRWPQDSCSYCRDIETAGGFSDRQRHLDIPDLSPVELDTDPTATSVTPTILEVFFNSTCNLSCVYCTPTLSSSINAENLKHGEFRELGVELVPFKGQYRDLVPYFWDWFPDNFKHLRRFNVLGGEPLLQKEFDRLLDLIEQYPNPDCELGIVTNLMIPREKLQKYIERFQKLLTSRALKRIDVTCSIDCWGKEQEYMRWGIDLIHWESNFDLLHSQKWLTININQTISVLGIKSMPQLLEKLKIWRQDRRIGHWFSAVVPEPEYLKPYVLGHQVFAEDWEKILNLMPDESDTDQLAKSYMEGIMKQSAAAGASPEQIKNLFVYLRENDRRRGTDWRQVFPWLQQFEDHHVV